MRLIFTLVCVILLITGKIYAGGPFTVDELNNSGVALQWTDNKLIWYSEDGALSNTVSNKEAIQWIEEALAKWANASLQNADRNTVKTVDVTAEYGGSVGENIDDSNFDKYYSESESRTVIVFDKNGMVTKNPGGVGDDYESVPGLSQILLADSSGKKIIKGIVIFNGVPLDQGRVTEAQFKGAIQHELGHLFNLDHTQVNYDSSTSCSLYGDCPDSQYIPVMFPRLLTLRQGEELKTDDAVTISWLYPSSTFQNSFCVIKGEIQDKNGNPLQGVNVIAKRVSAEEGMTKADSRSMVSGVLYPSCTNDGHYYLYGIVPVRDYEVIYEALRSDEFNGMSGFEPLSDPPTGFDTVSIGTARCDSGGQEITMDTVKVPVENPCPTTKNKDDNNNGTDNTTSSSGGCSLIIH